MKLMPGQKMQVIAYGDRVEFVPKKNISAMRGFLKGINTDFLSGKTIDFERDRLFWLA
jgi:hypothetical protein